MYVVVSLLNVPVSHSHVPALLFKVRAALLNKLKSITHVVASLFTVFAALTHVTALFINVPCLLTCASVA